ncbi:glycosyltransferase family 2 protein [Agrobacterium bohemicum]|uniref:Glycosyltransferase n=1 Tax=Agrobacterium bohemicum TaxID=2052828 RepID=A0A135P7M3_9HYPH|nr:glycosyltransferase family 2 protein [Agrobacterium bohemicum]KXG87413.1 glycosyltransferase [Agrobacterium bohemicum]
MKLKIIQNADLAIAGSNPDHWISTGEDPSFEISFGYIRSPFLIIFLSSCSEALEPRLYLNRGHGYREEDSLPYKSTRKVAIIVDVGIVGVNKSLRFDPATQPCDFLFSVAASKTREEAEHLVRVRGYSEDGELWNVKPLPRFWLKIPRLPKSVSYEVSDYLDSIYQLAQLEPEPSPPGNVWLSVVVPVYNAPKRHLEDLVGSFMSQGSMGAELILSDDGSTSTETLAFYQSLSHEQNIKVLISDINGGIAAATNAGVIQASGLWVTFLDHDDVIAPHAFKIILSALLENSDVEFLYTDEAVVSERLEPQGLMLKPAYDPVLLSGMNYINHFSIYRRQKILDLGLFNQSLDGSQDYDLLLRYLEDLDRSKVYHLPFPAYWWRRTKGSYSQRFIEKATNAARKALCDSFLRSGHVIQVQPALTASLHRIDLTYDNVGDWPKVSIIIPSRDSYELLECVLRGIFEETSYPNFEVIVVDNGTTDSRVLELYKKYQQSGEKFRVSHRHEAFNFSRSVNCGLDLAQGECVLLLNNDIEVRESSWLKEMVSCLRFEGVGIVGAKLLYPNGSIQHAGVIVGFGGLAGHWYINKPENFGGPMNRLHVRNSVVCVTGAAMLISRNCLDLVGRFDEENFAVAYNDVDYCIRAYRKGFKAVWTPFASLYHHESASRGEDTHGPNRKRFEIEQASLRRLHRTEVFQDPTINPGYLKGSSVPSLSIPTRVFKARTNRSS